MVNAQKSRLPQITDEAAVARVFEMVSTDYVDCPLPGHDGVARLASNDDGDLQLWCDCLGAKQQWQAFRSEHWYSLADAYYSIRSGNVLDRSTAKISAPYRMVWRMFLLGAVGAAVPEPVELPALPETASENARAARDLFALLCGLRLALKAHLKQDPIPMAFAVTLVQDYCRIAGRHTANAAIHELLAAGVIVYAGRERGTPLYAPGMPQATRSISKERGMAPLSSRPSTHR